MKQIKIPWLIVPIILASTIAIGFFFNSYCADKGFFNIEKTNVDFIIQAPSNEQVTEIAGQEHIEAIVPYCYKAISVANNGKTVSSNLFVIEDESKLKNTVFSEELKLKFVDVSDDNPIFVSSDVAKTLSTKVGDSIKITIGNTQLEYFVKGIYGSDGRNVGGTMIALMTNGTKEVLGEGAKYNGAYICSNNNSATKTYLTSYKPEGDLRSRDEFDSDEQYQLYRDTRAKTDYSSSTFDASTYLKEQHNRYDAQLTRDMWITIGCAVLTVVVTLLGILIPFNQFEKKTLLANKKSGATYKQINSVVGKYFSVAFLFVVFSFILGIVANLVIWNISLISIINIVGITLAIVILAVWIIESQKIKKKIFN